MIGRGKVIRRFPMVLGVDLAGEVLDQTRPDSKPGMESS
jgi:hypothetical protein